MKRARESVAVGIVGFGRVGERVARDVIGRGGDIRVAGVAESDPARRSVAEKDYGLAACADFRELCEHPGIGVIYNATPNFMHARVAIRALEAGKHVFTEKPFGMTRHEVAAMLKAANGSAGRLQVDFEMRYSLLTRRIRDIIAAGEIGEPRNILFNHFCGGQGFTPRPGDWRAVAARSGGYYIEEGCHRLDIFRCYMGLDIESVSAVPAPGLRGPDAWHWYPEPACTLCFFPGGKLANLVNFQHRGVSAAPPGMENELGHEYNVSVAGSEGSLRADLWRNYIQIFRFEGPRGLTVLNRQESYPGIPGDRLHHDSTGFFLDFVERVRANAELLMDPLDSWKTTACVFACEESFRRGGERVTVDYALPDA